MLKISDCLALRDDIEIGKCYCESMKKWNNGADVKCHVCLSTGYIEEAPKAYCNFCNRIVDTYRSTYTLENDNIDICLVCAKEAVKLIEDYQS